MKRPTWRPGFIYTPIPNTILEWPLTPAEFTVYCCIARKTWGFGKETDVLAISQIVELSGIPRRTVERALAGLRKYGLLTMHGPDRHSKTVQLTTLRYLSGDAIQAVALRSGGVTVTPDRRTTREKRKGPTLVG